MGAKEEAVALKDEGNRAIANREWGKAVELYTKAIELDGAQCVFYSNRAQVSLLLPLSPAAPHKLPVSSATLALCIYMHSSGGATWVVHEVLY